MKYISTFLFIFIFCTLGFSQKNSDISGRMVDSTHQPLVGASAILYFQKDSVLTGFSLTDVEGKFIINNVAPGNYYLQLSYVGYNNQSKTITKDQFSGKIDFDEIVLKTNTDLEAVVVTNAPLEVRKDTIIYDADAFKTKENATVEDLLKKLPGIEVDDDGSITAQGEEVQNLYVDGKEFFGGDPKIATKNLPAEAIRNIEVYDKMSEKAEFTGVDDGEEEKTINLELREGYKKGWFGNINAAGGINHSSDGLYNAKGLLSRFSPKNQLAFIASSNNVNDQAFTYRDQFSMSGQSFGGGGGFGRGGGGIDQQSLGSGINEASVGGINFNTNFSEKVEFHGDYFFNTTTNNYDRFKEREYFQSAGDFDYEERNKGDKSIYNHRINSEITYKANRRNELKLESSVSIYDENEFNDFRSETLTNTGSLQNDNTRLETDEGNNIGIDADLFWKHRFKKDGRSFFANISYRNKETDQTKFTDAITHFYRTGDETILNQDIIYDYNIDTWKTDFSYTEPFSDRHYLEFNYILSNDTEGRDQNYYDLTSGSPVLDTDLTNYFNRDYLSNKGSANYRIIGEKHQFTFGAGYQSAQLEGSTSLGSTDINRTFSQFQSNFNWEYDIAQGKRFNVYYNTRLSPPSVNQLQPAIDNSNPLNIYEGNPNLEAQKNHNIGVFFFSFDRFSFTNIFASLRANITKDAIVNSQTFNADLIQTTTPVNIDNSWNANGRISYGKPIRALRAKIDLSTSLNYSNGELFLNGVRNDYDRINSSYSVELSNTNDEKVSISTEATFGVNNTTYSENEDNNQRYFNQRYDLDLLLNSIENWEFDSALSYRVYDLQNSGETQKQPILNASISRFFADNLGTIELSAVDILNKNKGISQSQNLNYQEQSFYNVLGRYATLGFVWKIMNKSQKQEKANKNVPLPAKKERVNSKANEEEKKQKDTELKENKEQEKTPEKIGSD